MDFFAEVFGGGLGQGCEDSEAAGIGDGGGELSVADPLHPSLNNRDCLGSLERDIDKLGKLAP